MAEQLLDTQQVAARLHVHPGTVFRLRRAGFLPAVKVGRKAVRFRPEDVAALIESRRERQAS